jgi:hypothetical protein
MGWLSGKAKDPTIQQNFEAIEQLVYVGNGSPENLVAAAIPAIYLNKQGGVGTTLYVKRANSGQPTGWFAVA